MVKHPNQVIKIIFVSILMLIVLIFLSDVSQAKTVTVDSSGEGDFLNIQDAIDNSSTDDEIFIKSGTYEERITINKSISIIGDVESYPMLVNNDNTSIIDVFSSNVQIRNIFVENNDSRLSDVNGIHIFNVTNVTLKNITFKFLARTPLYVKNSSMIFLDSLSFNACSKGIQFVRVNNFTIQNVDFIYQNDNALFGFAWSDHGIIENVSLDDCFDLPFGMSFYSCNNIATSEANLSHEYQGFDVHLRESTDIVFSNSLFNFSNVHCRSNSNMSVYFTSGFNISLNGNKLADKFHVVVMIDGDDDNHLNHYIDNNLEIDILYGFYNNSDLSLFHNYHHHTKDLSIAYSYLCT